MRNTLLALALAAGAQIAAPAGADPLQPVGDDVITPDTAIFTVIDDVRGDHLTLHMLHSVMSRNGQTIVFVGDEIRAILLSLKEGNTRRAACVTSITGRDGAAQLVHRIADFPKPGCLAAVGNFHGAGGLAADEIAVDTVATIHLNGNLIMDDPKR